MTPTDPNDRNSVIGVYASASRKTTRVLDDSNDDTREVTTACADELGSRGFEVELIHRVDRVGFKAGAGLTIMMTQLPGLFGIAGGGHNFFERAVLLAGQLGQTHYLVLALGTVAILLLLAGERYLPGKPVGLAVVALSIAAASVFGLPALGVATTVDVPAGLPSFQGPQLRLRDVEGIIPLACGCLLLAYIESVSAARTFAAKHGYTINPRQEFLGIGAANLAAALGHG